jgi:hypothetical protein
MLGRADKRVLPLLWCPAKSGDPPPQEEDLNVAVLEHAVGIFQRYAFAPDRGGRMIFADIDAWFASDDTSYGSAFVSICNALGLDVAYVRQGLRQWRESRQRALGRKADILRPPFRKPTVRAVSRPATRLPCAPGPGRGRVG